MAKWISKAEFCHQPKLLRMLNLLYMLQKRCCTIGQMASCLDCHERSVYRYLTLFQDAGFTIDKDHNNQFIIESSPQFAGAYEGDTAPLMGAAY